MQIQKFEEQWTKKVIRLICLCVIEFYVTLEFFFCPIVPNSNGHIISYANELVHSLIWHPIPWQTNKLQTPWQVACPNKITQEMRLPGSLGDLGVYWGSFRSQTVKQQQCSQGKVSPYHKHMTISHQPCIYQALSFNPPPSLSFFVYPFPYSLNKSANFTVYQRI